MSTWPKDVIEDDDMPVYYDENTLRRVRDALKSVGIDGATADAAINEMQNLGILFRERWNQDNRSTSG